MASTETKYLKYLDTPILVDKAYSSEKATKDGNGNVITTTYATKSELPTVNNGTLTVQKNGTNVATFTANQSDAVTANIIVPTKVSDITNDTGFITKTVSDLTNYYTKTNTYTKTEVDTLIGGIKSITYEIVTSLPEAGPTYDFNETKKIFMVSTQSQATDYYKEYICVNRSTTATANYKWEMIGTTVVDLSNYVTLDGNQTITGSKTFRTSIKINAFGEDTYSMVIAHGTMASTGNGGVNKNWIPIASGLDYNDNALDLGSSSSRWKDLYLSGNVYSSSTNYTSVTSIISAGKNNHTHSNKTVIDGITSAKVTNWDTAFTNNHTHSNKTVIDGITSTKVTSWDNAATNSHTHSNKTVLDNTTASFTTALNTKLTGITAGATKAESSSTNGNIKINGTETVVYTSPITATDVTISW